MMQNVLIRRRPVSERQAKCRLGIHFGWWLRTAFVWRMMTNDECAACAVLLKIREITGKATDRSLYYGQVP